MGKDQPLEDALDEERDEDGQIYVDRDKIDFDPDDGLLSGTAIDGTSEIPGSEDGDRPDPDGSDDSRGAEQKSEDNTDEGEDDTQS